MTLALMVAGLGVASGTAIDPDYHWEAVQGKDAEDYPTDWAACKRELGKQEGLGIIITGKKRAGEWLVQCMRGRGWRHVLDQPAAPEEAPAPEPAASGLDGHSSAIRHFSAGRYQKCVEAFTGELDGSDLKLRAKCYLKLGKTKQAYTDLDKAIAEEERISGGYDWRESETVVFSFAELYALRGRCKEALPLLDRAEELLARPAKTGHEEEGTESELRKIAETRRLCRKER